MLGKLCSRSSLRDPGYFNIVALPPSTILSFSALLELVVGIACENREERMPKASSFLLNKEGEMKIGCITFTNISLVRG